MNFCYSVPRFSDATKEVACGRDNARPVPWWRWCARGLLAVCALAVLIVGVANVVTVATTRDRVVTVEGAATALAGDAADAVVVLGASVYARRHAERYFG